MKQQTKRPPIKESVGAQYICFATVGDPGEFTGQYKEEVEKTEVVKKVSLSENGESTPVRGSGKTYINASSTSSTDISVEVIAFPSETIAEMRADTVCESGLILSGGNGERPYFAYGKVVNLYGGLHRFDWYPKCQLSANTDDIETSDTSFKEQNDTLTISAMPFDEFGHTVVSIKEDFKKPDGITEELFFSKPIMNEKELLELLPTPSGGEEA